MTDQNTSVMTPANIASLNAQAAQGSSKAAKASAPKDSARKAKSPSKSSIVQKLLGRAKGASIAEIIGATGWQPHSARAFLTGLRKKDITILRESRKDGETAYRIAN
mgnify:CR=1 FL=1